MERYLTKSRFKLACECETKLFYTRKTEIYADQSMDDPFLAELAKGGYQVGELAKYYFTDDAQSITVEETQYDTALSETKKRIDRGDRYIAEAAVVYGNFFIRVDIFEIDKAKKQINLFEVKSKSWYADDQFLKVACKGEKKGQTILNPDWTSYLMDVAFQKQVISKAYPGYRVNAFLMLVNKNATATVNGLNQFFKVKSQGRTYKIVVDEGLQRSHLGAEVLVKLPVDDEIDFIWNNPVDSLVFPGYDFSRYMDVLAQAYKIDERINTPVSKACKSCQFYKKPDDDPHLKSGMEECWVEKLRISQVRFTQPKVTELWGGKAGAVSIVQKMMDKGKYFIEDLDRDDIDPEIPDMTEGELSPAQRRWEQIRRTKASDQGFYLDKIGLKAEMDKWIYPLHFIDFETASPALPFTKAAHPYEGIAFQYSHHTVALNKDGSYNIVHKNQFLKTDPGVNPNLAFIRELKRDLAEDGGTIFRYHNHENTYLRKIHAQLQEMPDSTVPDKAPLLQFIDSVTQQKVDKTLVAGTRNMVDLYELVVKYYYSPHARGSNSLKQILPAAIHDSAMLREKYSKPLYGKGKEATSLNFDSKIWIDAAIGNDPYKTLPEVFEGFSNERLDDAFSEFSEVADGGAAMMAYAKLQFFNTDPEQREAIRKALLRYCELDTLAMVMLWEFFYERVNK